jgi:hypothetical protein
MNTLNAVEQSICMIENNNQPYNARERKVIIFYICRVNRLSAEQTEQVFTCVNAHFTDLETQRRYTNFSTANFASADFSAIYY